jgi:transposase
MSQAVRIEQVLDKPRARKPRRRPQFLRAEVHHLLASLALGTVTLPWQAHDAFSGRPQQHALRSSRQRRVAMTLAHHRFKFGARQSHSYASGQGILNRGPQAVRMVSTNELRWTAMEEAKPKARRRHDRDLKSRVQVECNMPGASVAKVALDHGLNANLVHKWRREAAPGHGHVEVSPSPFVAVALRPPTNTATDIRIDMRRGQSITVTWPLAAAADCAVWIRELLR